MAESSPPPAPPRAYTALLHTAGRFFLQLLPFLYSLLLLPLARAALWLCKETELNKGWEFFLCLLHEKDYYLLYPLFGYVKLGLHSLADNVKFYVWNSIVETIEYMWDGFRTYWNSNSFSQSLDDAGVPVEGDRKRLTIVLDLDETLVHAVDINSVSPSMMRTAIENKINYYRVDSWPPIQDQLGEYMTSSYMVFERPGLQEFLDKASQLGELHVFTAGTKEYASPVIDKIDPEGRIRSRLYRTSTIPTRFHSHVKDLSRIGLDLRRTLIVDNTPMCFLMQPMNGIPCYTFHIFNGADKELVGNVLPAIENCTKLEDVRPYIHETYNMMHYFRCMGITY